MKLTINSDMNTEEISEIVSVKLLSSLEKTFANNVYKSLDNK